MLNILMITNNMELNGISTVVMNYFCNIDSKKFHIEIAAGTPVADKYINVVKDKGSMIHALPSRKLDSWNYYKGLYHILKRKRFDIVHVHGNSSTMAVELLIAYLCGVKIRIAHSHSTTCENMKLHKIMKPFFKVLYTHGFACGELAGKWMFNNHSFTVIPNGFIIEKFKYNEDYRKEIRGSLKIEDKFVLGHVGRFNAPKNQAYLLKIFKFIAEKKSDAVLLLVGTGPMFNEIKQQIELHPYRDRIILYGETTTPEKLYMAMDVFVFPSRYEGLPVTLLEAQISGLPCLISDVITDEAVLSNHVQMLSIDEEPQVWVKHILTIKTFDRKELYYSLEKKIDNYNIKNNVRELEKMYTNCIKK